MDAKEARIYLAVVSTVIVLGIILIYYTVSIIRQQRRNLELQQANALAEISAMEKERARIATDLHDDLGPVLSVIKFSVDNVELVDPEEKAELVKASAQLDELIRRMREVANNLMPSALIRKGLIGAVKEFTRNVSATNVIQISFTADEHLEMGEDKSINTYRVIQEVVHNCIKHAGATQLEIVFATNNGYLTIVCRDNGKGFDYPKLSKESMGIGLRSIRNRTSIMGGHLQVESEPGKGTAFLFKIPF